MFKLDLDQIANIHWIIEKAREFQKKNLLHWLRWSLWLCGSQQTMENSLRDGNARPPDLPPEKSVCRSRSWTWNKNLFQISKGVRQGCILSPCLFNFHAEYIMRNTGLDETQAGIKIAGRNIKSLLMKVKEESEKAGLKLNIQKMIIMASDLFTSWQ